MSPPAPPTPRRHTPRSPATSSLRYHTPGVSAISRPVPLALTPTQRMCNGAQVRTTVSTGCEPGTRYRVLMFVSCYSSINSRSRWQVPRSHILNHCPLATMPCADAVIIQASEASGLIPSSPLQAAYQECVYMDVSLVHHTTLVHPSFKLARPCPTPPSPRPMSYRSPSPRPSANLPDEIFAQIAQYVLGNAFCGLDVAQPAAEIRKPSFGDIDGMTRASRRLRAISLPEWFRLFIVSHANDWVWASRLSGMHTWVRHIVCPPNALDWPAPSDVLSRFPYLRSASLSLSRDYESNPILPPGHESNLYPSAPAALEVLPGFNYRQPVSVFPPTMTSLSVRSTHGSETPLLRNLGMQCPDLRALRLG
ncbi:hypothetical protein FRC08_014837, partial [Ceratobasidium sp. 394]